MADDKKTPKIINSGSGKVQSSQRSDGKGQMTRQGGGSGKANGNGKKK